MNKITNTRQLRSISQNDFVVLTELVNPDHVNKKDRIHRSTCYVLDLAKKQRTMPTSKNYYHVRKSQKNILKKYKAFRCVHCVNQ